MHAAPPQHAALEQALRATAAPALSIKEHMDNRTFHNTRESTSQSKPSAAGLPSASRAPITVQQVFRNQSAEQGEQHMRSSSTHMHGNRPEPVRHGPIVGLPLSADGPDAPRGVCSMAVSKDAVASDGANKEVALGTGTEHGIADQQVLVPMSPVHQAAQPAVAARCGDMQREDQGLPAVLETPWLERVAAIAAAAASAAAAAVHAQQPAKEAPAIQGQPVRQQPPGNNASTSAAQGHTDNVPDGSVQSPRSEVYSGHLAAESSASKPTQSASRPVHAEEPNAHMRASAGAHAGSPSTQAVGPADTVVPAKAELAAGNGRAERQEQGRDEGGRMLEADAECLASVLQASHEGRRQHREAACEEQLLPQGHRSAAAGLAVGDAEPVLQRPPQQPHASTVASQRMQAVAPSAAERADRTLLGFGQAQHDTILPALEPVQPTVPRMSHQVCKSHPPGPAK